MNPGALLDHAVTRAVDALRAFADDPASRAAFAQACEHGTGSLLGGGRLYLLGNGGSAADALHVAAELVGRIGHERAPLAAEALVADPATLTALANDYGYAEVFARQLEAKLAARDVVVALSTSGRSANVVRALETCRARGATSLLFTGRAGGPAAAVADVVIAVASDEAKTVQEVHRVLLHAWCQALERDVAAHPGTAR